MAIIALILESAQNGATKTEIMRNVMLNYRRVNRYCAMLSQSGLLYYNSENHLYKTSPKGKKILNDCNELFQYIEPINQMVTKYRIYLSAVES